jgi:Tfp pilus assembly protein PilF
MVQEFLQKAKNYFQVSKFEEARIEIDKALQIDVANVEALRLKAFYFRFIRDY